MLFVIFMCQRYKKNQPIINIRRNNSGLNLEIGNQFQMLIVKLLEIITIFAIVIQLSMKLIELNLQRIFDLCRQHRVRTLAVFGSILTDRFNDNSDVDLLVDFEPIEHDKFDYVDNYFGLRDALERLFNRKVDLIEEKGLRNKYFIANVNRTKQLIYGL